VFVPQSSASAGLAVRLFVPLLKLVSQPLEARRLIAEIATQSIDV